MAIQDRQFDTASQLYFPPSLSTPSTHSFWSVVFEGDVAMVNGVPWPYLNVEPRRYRFRLLNGSNHRAYSLSFGNAIAYQIGADEGYLSKAAQVSTITLAPGERADVIVDFSNMMGQSIMLTNSEMGEMYQLPVIMQFRVNTALQGADTSCNPAHPVATGCAWPTEVRLTDGKGHLLPGVKIDKVRQLVINENFDLPTALDEYLNNTKWDGLMSPSTAASFSNDGISEAPRVGSIELWEIINMYLPGLPMQFHPIHTHLTQFQVLNRQKFDLNAYYMAWQTAFGKGGAALPSNCSAGAVCPGYGSPLDYNTLNADGALGGNPALSPFLMGNPIPPSAGETGWKDTAVSQARQVLRILVRVTPTDTPFVPNQSYTGTNLFPFDPTEGLYVWHCHILNHEDNEMMRPFKIMK
jgi:FtsP/CotA-like multicopper oxidase with cupredoxin domain